MSKRPTALKPVPSENAVDPRQIDFIAQHEADVPDDDADDARGTSWLAYVALDNDPFKIVEASNRKDLILAVEALTDSMQRVHWICKGKKLQFKETKTVKFI